MPDGKTIGPGNGVSDSGHPDPELVEGEGSSGFNRASLDSSPSAQNDNAAGDVFVTMPGGAETAPLQPQVGLSPQRESFFAAETDSSRHLTIVNHHKNSPIYGYVPEFRGVVEEFMGAKGYLLANGVTKPYEGGNERLQRNFRRLEVTFEHADDDSIHAKNARLEGDVLHVTLAVNERHIGEIIGNLHPGALAFLLVHSYDRGRETSIPLFALAEPASYTGDGLGLYKKLAEVGNRFLKDKNPIVGELKTALRQRTVPAMFARTLLKAGWSEKDIGAIARLVGEERFRFNIEARRMFERGRVDIYTIMRYPLQYIEVWAHPDDIASFTRADIYSAMARGAILATSFSKNRQLWRFDRTEIARPLHILSKHYQLAGGSLVRNIYGDWKGDWLFRVDHVLRLLTAFPAIAAKRGEEEQEKGEKEAVLRRLSARVGSAEKVPEWLGAAVKALVEWGPTRGFSKFARVLFGTRDFVVVTSASLKGGVTAEIDKNDNAMMIISVPETGYQQISEADIFAAVGRLKIGKEEVLSAPAAEETFGILKLLLARSKNGSGASAFNIAIDGDAPRATLNGLAAMIGRLWDGSAAVSLEAEAFRSWAEQRKNIFVEQIAAQDGQEKTIAIPVEDGLLVLVEGSAPSEVQWKTLLATAYLKGDKPVAVYHGRKGDVADVSGYDPKRVRDFMDRVAGRTRSVSEGAEANPAWAASTDKVKKERFVRALRWMQENRRRFILDVLPAAQDGGAALKKKHDRFSKLYHPDRHPADTALFGEANQHWAALRDIFRGDIAMSVDVGAMPGSSPGRFAHYLRMIAEEMSRASSVEEVTRRLTDLAKEFELDPRELIDSVFNADNRLHRLWNESAGRAEMDALRGRLKTLKGRASAVDARPAEHVK